LLINQSPVIDDSFATGNYRQLLAHIASDSQVNTHKLALNQFNHDTPRTSIGQLTAAV